MKSRKRTHIVRPFKVNSRDSAYQIEFAVQIPKIRGHVPRSAAEKPRKDSVRILTYRGKKFRPSGGTFGRLWNGLRSVPLVGETAVLRQPEGGPTVRHFSIPFRLKSCKICVNFSTTHCQNVLYLICIGACTCQPIFASF